jgi:putative nucleotidyltransferase with HDIG domain
MEESINIDFILTRPALIIDRTRNAHGAEDCVQSATDLSELLKDRSLSYQSIFISVDQPGFSALESAEEVRRRFPLSPIYLVYGDEEPLKPFELRRLGIRNLVQRDEVENVISERNNRYREIVPVLNQALERRKSQVQRGASISEPFQIPGFYPVLAEDMLSGDISLFDVHMLLPNQKRIKIFAANDAFDSTRVLKYIAGGVHWVYVKEDSLQQCLKYCRFLSSTVIQNKDVSDEIKFLHVANICERTIDKFPAILEGSKELLEIIQQLLINVRGDPKRMIRSFFKHSELLHHSLSVTFIFGLLSMQMKMDSLRTFEALGFASLFHDIGLMQLPKRLRVEDSDSLTGAERLLYETHCEKGVQLLESFGVANSSILQAVAQHHERWDTHGFPNRQGSGQIHVFAELIGISDELTWTLKENRESDRKKILSRFREENFNRFSLPVIQAFDAVFGV